MRIINYRLLVSLLGIFLFSSFLLKGDAGSIQKSMARFEQAFIPVHYYVQKGNMIEAKSSLIYMDHEWNILYEKYSNHKAGDWSEAFRRTDEWMKDLCEQVNSNQKVWSATLLGHIQYEMKELRRKNGIKYYFDAVYDFESSWGTVVEITDDRMMCLYEWNEFEEFVRWSKRDWAVSESQDLPVELLNLTDEQIINIQIRREVLSKRLHNYRAILSCGDQGTAHREAVAIQKLYFEFIRLLGRNYSDRSFMATVG